MCNTRGIRVYENISVHQLIEEGSGGNTWMLKSKLLLVQGHPLGPAYLKKLTKFIRIVFQPLTK